MLCWILLLAFAFTGQCEKVKQRSVGTGSEPDNVGGNIVGGNFFPGGIPTTIEPLRTESPNQSGGGLSEEMKKYSCLNVGSSADRVSEVNEIIFGNLPFIPTEYPHLIPNCSFIKPFVTPGNFTTCEEVVDLVFLVDVSGSVGPVNFIKEKTFIAQSAMRFKIGYNNTQVSVVTFSTTTHKQFDLKAYGNLTSLLDAIDKIPYQSGGTNTAQALDFINNNIFVTASGDRPDGHDVLVVITDGMSTNRKQTIQTADQIKLRGIEIIAVGIGSGLDQEELNGIASDPSYVVNVADFDALNVIHDVINNLTCTTTDNNSTGSIRNGTAEHVGSGAGGISTTPIFGTRKDTSTEPTAATTMTTGAHLRPGSSAGGSRKRQMAKRNYGVGSSAGAFDKGFVLFPAVDTGNSSTGGHNGGTGSGGVLFPTVNSGSGSTVGSGNGTEAGTGSSTNNGGNNTTGTGTGTDGTGTGTGTGSGSGTGTTPPSSGTGGSLHGVTNSLSTELPDYNREDNFTNYNHSAGECRDLVNCRVYPKEKICQIDSIYYPWASVRCQVYCSICDPHTSPKPCVDQLSNCNEYDADLCINPLYRLFREDNCRQFCSLC